MYLSLIHIFGGYVEGDKRVVTDVYLLRNVDESREHFSMDPAQPVSYTHLDVYKRKVYKSAGYMLRIDCWEAEKDL